MTTLSQFLSDLKSRTPNEEVFHQAVEEVFQSIIPLVEAEERFRKAKILERLVSPERVILFRVTWVDDGGEIQVNRGYRVQMNGVLGPFKGGLRFHPSVSLGVLKFLAFEQSFKNALTLLPMGGAKGGSDFDPKGKSDAEVMRFCQSFMGELARHIGHATDVPAGDIGVGGREIGFLQGAYRKFSNRFDGTLTGKGHVWGGSLLRPEATGYGLVYFTREMLKRKGETLKGKRVTVSGAGNVAQYTTEKIIELGGTVLSLSDSDGSIYDPAGLDAEKLAFVMELKNIRRGRIKEYAERFRGAEYRPGMRPWDLKCDIAMPCATQNELELEDAKSLLSNGCWCVAEGANMPSTNEALAYFRAHKILFAPAKAANAGGVACSGLELSQNRLNLYWTAEEVDERLKGIMAKIHEQCVQYGEESDFVDYVKGANMAAFLRLAEAMIAQGIV